MRMTMLRTLVAAGALLLASSATTRADETTFCNFFITTLPYTVTTQGHYCFDRNLSTAIETGNAITINSDFVVLDLNNFKLGGGSAGSDTNAVGVYANNRSNLTIRNGNIRGFAFGIRIGGTIETSAQNIVVENNAVDGNLVGGISVYGNAYLIRNNFVTNTGGGTSATVVYCGTGLASRVSGIATYSVGLVCEDGGKGEIANNTVIHTVEMAGGTGGAISIYGAGGVVKQNLIITQPDNLFSAVFASVCRDNTAFDITGNAYACGALVGSNSDT